MRPAVPRSCRDRSVIGVGLSVGFGLGPTLLIAALCLGACAAGQAPGGAEPDGAPAVDLAPPADQGVADLAPPGAVTVVRVHYPTKPTGPGSAISLRGDQAPLSWERGAAMTRVSDTVYELRLPALAAPLEFKPLLDDSAWSRGANFRVRPGEAVDVFPYFTSTAGAWSRRYPALRSEILKNTRGVWVYLPPGYEENPLGRYPVLYMHDGQNLFDPKAAFGGVTWGVPETLDRGAAALEASARIPEVIVVGPENAGAARVYEYTPTEGGEGGGGGDLYLRFLVEELKPKIDAELRTDPGRSALAGSSLGGLISSYAGLKQARTFSRIAAFSPSTWWDGTFLLGAVRGSAGMSPRPERVYVDSGDSGPSKDDVANTRLLAQAYRDVGYRDGVDLLHVVQAGAQHSEAYWAQRLPAALRFLLAGW